MCSWELYISIYFPCIRSIEVGTYFFYTAPLLLLTTLNGIGYRITSMEGTPKRNIKIAPNLIYSWNEIGSHVHISTTLNFNWKISNYGEFHENLVVRWAFHGRAAEHQFGTTMYLADAMNRQNLIPQQSISNPHLKII